MRKARKPRAADKKRRRRRNVAAKGSARNANDGSLYVGRTHLRSGGGVLCSYKSYTRLRIRRGDGLAFGMWTILLLLAGGGFCLIVSVQPLLAVQDPHRVGSTTLKHRPRPQRPVHEQGTGSLTASREDPSRLVRAAGCPPAVVSDYPPYKIPTETGPPGREGGLTPGK